MASADLKTEARSQETMVPYKLGVMYIYRCKSLLATEFEIVYSQIDLLYVGHRDRLDYSFN